MRGFRAKDADRDACVELIEAAFVDGQLNSADRDLRVGRALSAETVDELQTLTRDLQLPPGQVLSATPSGPPSRLSSGSRRVGGVLVGLVVFVALVVAGVTAIVALFYFASSDGEVTTTTVVPSASAAPEVSVEEAEAPSFEMTAGQVRAFLGAYEEQFGTLEVYEAAFYPGRVGVMVPVRGSRPRMERWSWTGEWRQDTEASRVTGPGGIVDLGTVDVRRMFANIDTARRTLEVDRGKLTHVLVNRWFDDQAAVNIYIGNQFGESGYLRTTPPGEVVRAYPYDA
jgi:hypothetical protein